MSRNLNKDFFVFLIAGLFWTLFWGLKFGFAGIFDLFLPYFFSISSLIFSLSTMQKQCNILSVRYFTIHTMYFFGYLFMIFIPATLNFPYFFTFKHLFELNPNANFFYATCFSMPLYAVGIMICNNLLKFKYKEQIKYFKTSIAMPHINHNFLITAFLTLTSIGIFILYFLQIDIPVNKLPIIRMILHDGGGEELALARESVFKMLDPHWSNSKFSFIFYFYLALKMWLFPFLVIYTFLMFLITKKRVWLALLFINFFASVFYAAVSIARAPLAALFLRISIAWYYFKLCKLNIKQIIFSFLIVISFPLLVTLMAYDHNNFFDGFKAFFRRLFITPAEDLFVYFKAFPAYFDFQYGSTLLKPLRHLLGVKYFYIENEIYNFQFPFSNIKTGHANAAYLSNLYADFGLFGCLVGSLLLGFLIQFLAVFLMKQKKDALNVTVYIFLIYALWVLNFGSITSVLGTNGVFFILLIPYFYRFIDKYLSTINK